ncbi:DEAD/DEAH box helicase [Cytophagaceae bacterium ABcell3]|nr:DEAD/DEAH box helicase [Cytophagaceae bacterium ABcell3]
MVEKILDNLNITALNKMQEAFLASENFNKDVILLSPTGTGKTLAFLLHVVQRLKQGSGVQALIISPSRELSLQIEQVFRNMGTGFKVACFYGGHPMKLEKQSLIEPPALLIGTPGRLADHLRKGSFDPVNIKSLVLDEFDKSLELGFEDDMSFIIGELSGLKKRILTSATKMEQVPAFVKADQPVTIDFLSTSTPDKLTIKVAKCDSKYKPDSLFNLVCGFQGEQSIVFCNHREAVERLCALIADQGVGVEMYHGGMGQEEREKALIKYRNKSAQVLVCTDLGARGLDIPSVKHVVHYQFPVDDTVWTHRNGRTARMGASGSVWLLMTQDEYLPAYLKGLPTEEEEVSECASPVLSEWETVYFGAGRKDKVNKIDIVGALYKKGQLSKDDLGLIEVKDKASYAAVRKSKLKNLLKLLAGEKIKNRKVKFGILR